MGAAVIDFLIAVLVFCWKVFYWGSFTATMMAFTGCVFAGYYLFKERYPKMITYGLEPTEWIGSLLIILVCAFVPLLNTACAWFLFTEHKSIVSETLKEVELKYGIDKDEIPF